MMVQLSLGTAQWGNGYGVTNASGQLSDAECVAIMDLALASEIRAVDTAMSYGEAQERLRPWVPDLSITTKISGRSVPDQASACLAALDTDAVAAMLLHDWDALESSERTKAVQGLRDVRDQGRAELVGVSVYDEAGIASALEYFAAAGLALGVIQVPANALDRRLDDADIMRRLASSGTWVQVRSVFLQGLLAGPSDAALAKHLDVVAFHAWCAGRGLSPLAFALAHVRSLAWADEIVVGLANAEELAEIVAAWNVIIPERADPQLTSADLDLIDPRRW